MRFNDSVDAGMRIRRAMLLSVLIVLGGCASMSEDECRTADWHEQGLREALAGHPRTRLEEDRKACGKVGIAPDEQQYLAGYNLGIQQFCTPENGARWGRDGKYYSANTCPAMLESAFQQRYRLGRAAYDAEQNVQWLRNQQRDVQSKLDKAKDDAERSKLRSELDELDHRLRNARDDLDRAEARLRS